MLVLQIFQPDTGAERQTLVIAIVAALVALGLMWGLLRRPSSRENRNTQLLLAMLLFFAGLISGGTAIFTGWTIIKLQPVSISATGIEMPGGMTKWADIRSVYIFHNQQKSLINPGLTRRTVRMLVIEEQSGKTHVLSEEQYPVNEIYGRIKEQRNE